jgi:hypothetical protein
MKQPCLNSNFSTCAQLPLANWLVVYLDQKISVNCTRYNVPISTKKELRKIEKCLKKEVTCRVASNVRVNQRLGLLCCKTFMTLVICDQDIRMECLLCVFALTNQHSTVNMVNWWSYSCADLYFIAGTICEILETCFYSAL